MNEHRPGPEADGRKAASSLRDERVKNCIYRSVLAVQGRSVKLSVKGSCRG